MKFITLISGIILFILTVFICRGYITIYTFVGDNAVGIQYRNGIVQEISEKSNGNFFIPDSWTVKVKFDNSKIFYGTIFEPVLIGQTVYAKTWRDTVDGFYHTSKKYVMSKY